MMKIKARMGGREIVVLGLSYANLDRLRADGLDGFIKIDGKELGLAADVWITAAPTEAVMIDAFQGAIGPATKIHIDKRFKS